MKLTSHLLIISKGIRPKLGWRFEKKEGRETPKVNGEVTESEQKKLGKWKRNERERGEKTKQKKRMLVNESGA